MNDDVGVTPITAEAKAVEQVTRTVQARHPNVPPEHIAELARAEHQRYAKARIREFVPLLVERALLSKLYAHEQSP
ncbi:MAG: hypothetical protein SYR96_17605 [Actinomycetota bacterium]|nr:hypothetical protein [Actinomycetota bacterium]